MKELPSCEEHPALTFLGDVIQDMGLDLKMDAKADDSNIYIELSGDDCGTIIGRRIVESETDNGAVALARNLHANSLLVTNTDYLVGDYL